MFSPPILSVSSKVRFPPSRRDYSGPTYTALRPSNVPLRARMRAAEPHRCAGLYLDPVVVCFVRVLAESRWWAADGQAFTVDEDRRGEHFEVSGRGMIQVLQHARAE